MILIDSHCHIHDTEFYTDSREDVYKDAMKAGVGMIVVGTDSRSSYQAVQFAATHQDVWAVVGIHPHETKDGYEEIEKILKQAQKQQKIVGIGEIGLDYYYMHSPRQTQIKALEVQLQLARDCRLPVSFHVRETSKLGEEASVWKDFWPILDNFPDIKGVMHSFTDTQANLEQGFERGLFVGINGISTFTRDEEQQKLYQNVPVERMLLETDAPFLTPTPFRGTMNEPKYVERVARHMAEVRGLPFEQICQATLANTKQLFNL